MANRLIAECDDEVLSADQIIKLYMPTSKGSAVHSSPREIDEEDHFSGEDEEENNENIESGGIVQHSGGNYLPPPEISDANNAVLATATVLSATVARKGEEEIV